MPFSHLDADGKAAMVDVGAKDYTVREATAEAVLRMRPETLAAIQSSEIAKGDVLSCARIAGIQAGKQTASLIPLCHSLPLEKIAVDFCVLSDCTLQIRAYAKCTYKTGVEMEALTAASVAALTVYDMCKAIDRGMEITHLRLLHKSGGKSGEFYAENNT